MEPYYAVRNVDPINNTRKTVYPRKIFTSPNHIRKDGFFIERSVTKVFWSVAYRALSHHRFEADRALYTISRLGVTHKNHRREARTKTRRAFGSFSKQMN
jgi:hypothetical protein